jgi:serine protease Do
MRNSNYFLGFALFIGVLCSCAHKSGHIRQQQQLSSKNVPFNDAPVVAKTKSTNSRLEGNQIFSKFHSAVFMVYTTDGSNVYQGSGFFIDNQGLAVSNYHVFKNTGIGMEAIKLEGDDTAYKVSEIYKKSEEYDFILFRVECGRTNYIPIALHKPSIGDRIFTIGSPKGLENTFSSGDVSQWRDDYIMQISAAIDHGSSGGALINEYGEVVGITSGTLDANSQANLNYAWSIEVLKPYLNFQ